MILREKMEKSKIFEERSFYKIINSPEEKKKKKRSIQDISMIILLICLK
jgi:hypothetical protein